MFSSEEKSAVITYAHQHGIDETALLFEGIISKSTIYRWLQEYLDYSYTEPEYRKEYENYKKLQPRYLATIGTNRIVHSFQPHFFHKERELWKDKKIRKKLLENRQKYLGKSDFTAREILRGFKISGIHIGYSHFSPLWLAKFVQDYDVSTIYDPCGGWGHRLIGAGLANINYIYNDKWALSVDGAKKIADAFNIKATCYNQDCTTFTPEEEYDAVFTCPPYYNIEVYEQPFSSPQQYEEFIGLMLQRSVKPRVKIVGIVINLTYQEIIKESASKNLPEFEHIDTHMLGTTNSTSHLNHDSDKEEILLVFKRT